MLADDDPRVLHLNSLEPNRKSASGGTENVRKTAIDDGG